MLLHQVGHSDKGRSDITVCVKEERAPLKKHAGGMLQPRLG
jgi:hypothetical protein